MNCIDECLDKLFEYAKGASVTACLDIEHIRYSNGDREIRYICFIGKDSQWVSASGYVAATVVDNTIDKHIKEVNKIA